MMKIMYQVEDIINNIIDDNEEISLWVKSNQITYKKIWNGMAYEIPEEYKKKTFLKIFGTFPQTIIEADVINILVE